MKSIRLACATGMWLALSLNPSWAHETSTRTTNRSAMTDEQSIAHTMKSIFDKPGSPLKVGPVSIEGRHAVAGWIQDDRGGRALLKKEHGKWSIQACGGDDFKQASSLSMTGIENSAAIKLAQKISAAEANIPRDQVDKFSLFEGIAKVEDEVHGQPAKTPDHALHHN